MIPGGYAYSWVGVEVQLRSCHGSAVLSKDGSYHIGHLRQATVQLRTWHGTCPGNLQPFQLMRHLRSLLSVPSVACTCSMLMRQQCCGRLLRNSFYCCCCRLQGVQGCAEHHQQGAAAGLEGAAGAELLRAPGLRENRHDRCGQFTHNISGSSA